MRSPTLPRVIDPAVDAERLYAAGVEHAQRLSGALWTDYNVHDPGVTMLELLCYAITDLQYRSSMPVADLLRSSGEAPATTTLFTARRVLTQHALTVLDYRKLLVDLPGVRNAWLLPAELQPALYADTRKGVLQYEPSEDPEVRAVHVKGLYRVILDLNPALGPAEQKEVVARATALLHTHRNLCEDFVGIDLVPTQHFNLCCELELDPQSDPSLIQAAILFQVNRVLSPTVLNYTLEELLTHTRADGTPYTIEDAFCGPALACGFIDDEELRASELKPTIYLSDLLSVIQDIPGVLAVRDIVFTPTGASAPPKDRWRVPVRAGHKAQLNPTHSRMVFYKRSTPLLGDPARVAAELARLEEAERVMVETARDEDLPAPAGRARDVGGYDSVQGAFPPLYGLGAESVPVEPRRKDLARQLKGYLLHFDQLMADHLALLANLGRLTSTDPTLRVPRFHQLVDTLHDYAQVYKDPTQILAALGAADSAADLALALRNRMLDHLSARFGEDYAAQLGALRSAAGLGVVEELRRKCALLAALPELGSTRGLGYDRTRSEPEQQWNTLNISGLERRLAHLLTLDDPRRRNLSSVAYDLYAQIDSTPGDQHRFRVRDAATGDILLSSSTFYTTPAAAREELRVAIELAKDDAAYARHTTQGGDRWYFNLVDPTGEVVARRIEYFRSAEAMEEAIAELQQYVRTHYSDEGLYVIEGLLLRPWAEGDPLLPICPEPGCTDCTESDPYSHRVYIVLPAYGRRFRNMQFRALVEDTIRAELPAHLLPRICWASQDDMAALEGPYRQWIRVLAGDGSLDRAEVLTRLRDALFTIRNVYPTRTLAACDAPEDEGRFILGESALGTAGKRTTHEG